MSAQASPGQGARLACRVASAADMTGVVMAARSAPGRAGAAAAPASWRKSSNLLHPQAGRAGQDPSGQANISLWNVIFCNEIREGRHLREKSELPQRNRLRYD